MVLITRVLYYAAKRSTLHVPQNLKRYERKGFLDHLVLNVQAGAGGSGYPRFGGIGGRGGNVCLQASEDLTLRKVDIGLQNKNLKAERGGDSTARGLIGQPGKDLVIRVPTGVTVYDNKGVKIGEVNELDAKLIVAEGGIGGCKETDYCGLKGQYRKLHLDLKLISDVALVGFPNAGKSTFLKTVSRAVPKVADYPFTTIKPHIGMMEFSDLRTITVGDLPGLIEGAHRNIGMGHNFLKHIERSKMMLFIVDVNGFQLSPRHTYRNCLETVILLNKEIELYKPDLLDMPATILINKMDMNGAEDTFKGIKLKLEKLEDYLEDFPEELRPDKVIKFEKILKTSILNASKGEVDLIKKVIRETLDRCVKREEFDEKDDLVIELITKMKRDTKQISPNLV